MLKPFIAIIGACCAVPALAAWQLDSSASQLHFLSIKNSQVTEVHAFKSFEGTIDDTGKLAINVDLRSVATGIPIRDTRMQEKLFETGSYSQARFNAEIPKTVLSMPVATSAITTLQGTIELHNKKVATDFTVMVNHLDDATFTVATVKPALLNADDFDLGAGVEALQSIAGLQSITKTVPVTFAATFTRE